MNEEELTPIKIFFKGGAALEYMVTQDTLGRLINDFLAYGMFYGGSMYQSAAVIQRRTTAAYQVYVKNRLRPLLLNFDNIQHIG